MMELELVGGARTVTGPSTVRTSRATVLLECGLFQGHRAEANRRNREALPIDVAALDAVVLSHAHLDHSGALPVLAQHGYRGPIYATPATRDLCGPMLHDAAASRSRTRATSRGSSRGRRRSSPVTPLYTRADVDAALQLMAPVAYHDTRSIAPGIAATFYDAGHVLGSAIVVLDLADGDDRARLVFTGDLGRVGSCNRRDPDEARVRRGRALRALRRSPPWTPRHVRSPRR